MSVFDIPASALIKAVASDLKRQGVKQPDWTLFVKTGQHRERAPEGSEWFFERMASVLYRIYKQGPLGTESLRNYYGGKKRRGVRKPHFRKAGGKIVRVCLQQLERQGLIKKSKKGRIITGKGHSYLNQRAKEAASLAIEGEKKAAMAWKERHEEKSTEEKRVEKELKKQEKAARDKLKAAEEEKKRKEKKKEHKEEKKAETA